MLEKPIVKKLIFILIAGEIATAIGGILADSSAEEFARTAVFFAEVWAIYSLISVLVDRRWGSSKI